jgi:hypothetical protein
VRSAECGVRSDNGNNERPSPRRPPITQRAHVGCPPWRAPCLCSIPRRPCESSACVRSKHPTSAKTADGGQRPGIAIRHSARSKRRARRAPGVAVFRGGVLTTGGFEAASSRLPAAPAASSPDLLGRGRHDAQSLPLFLLSARFQRAFGAGCGILRRKPARGGQARWKRAQKQRDNEDGVAALFSSA